MVRFNLLKLMVFLGMVFASQQMLAFNTVATAKYMCGSKSASNSVVSGRYETVLDLTNPNFLPGPYSVRNFALTVYASTPVGSADAPAVLESDLQVSGGQAHTINCAQIRAATNQPSGYIEGNLVYSVYALGVGASTEALRQNNMRLTSTITARKRTGTDPDVRQYDVETVAIQKCDFVNSFIDIEV